MKTLSTLLDPAQPAAWLLGSTALAIVAVNLAWLVARHSRRVRATGAQIAAWLAIALFFIFPPLFAWRAGALSPTYLGLSGLDWIPSLMNGAPVIAIVLAVLVAGWLIYRRTLPRPSSQAGRGHEQVMMALRAPLDAALCQWHWAFYRAAAVAWIAMSAPGAHSLSRTLNLDLAATTAADALYWGSWLGLLFLAVEWALNPFTRSALRTPVAQEKALRQIALAIATTAIFALTRNLWICWICHVTAETLIVGWLGASRVAETGA